MDFAWSKEQADFRQRVADFARKELNEGLLERDRAEQFNRDGWKKCADLGIHGLPVPEHPTTPIVLVEDRRNTNSWILPARNKHHTDNHAALRECFAALQKAGVKGLFYLKGDDLLGDDAEAATDGSHPSDLGFVRQADRFEPVLRKALRRAR